jgi:hypothetical protein
VTDEQRDASRLLTGIENGTLSAADAIVIVERIDPVLVYLVVSYLREIYASDRAGTAVLQRVVELSQKPAFVRKFRAGEEDPISKWFLSEHSFGDFRHRGAELIEIVVDKLES